MTDSGSPASATLSRVSEPFASLGSVRSRLAWAVAVTVVATLAVSGVFSVSRVFYLRDLAGYFWPHHLWLRRTLWNGFFPFWAPDEGLGYATIADPNLQLLFPLTIAGRLVLPDVVGFNPRVLVITSYRVVPDPMKRIAALFDRSPGPSTEVLLEGPPPAPAGAAGKPVTSAAVAIVEEWPTGMRIEVEVPDGGGFLVVRDAYDANWVADVDGVRAPLLEADGLFRAVRLSGGRHDVVFRYRSRPLLVGVAISIAVAIALIIGCGLARPAERPEAR